jgi:uncharacterized membrane protein YqhA
MSDGEPDARDAAPASEAATTVPVTGPPREDGPAPAGPPALIRRMVALSRYVVLVAVVGLFAAFIVLIVSFALTLVREIVEALHGDYSQKELVSLMVQEADIALLATVIYVIALGLYSLFVDDSIPMPEWLSIHTLTDLKKLLASVVVVVLAVLFLGLALTWNGSRDLLVLGLSIGAVIAALSLFLLVSRGEDTPPHHDGRNRGNEGRR